MSIGDTPKMPLPGWGLVVVDTDKDDIDDNFGKGAQIGTLIRVHEEDKSRPVRDDSEVTYGYLEGKAIYCRAYVEADGRWLDKALNQDVMFVDLSKIMGFDSETTNT